MLFIAKGLAKLRSIDLPTEYQECLWYYEWTQLQTELQGKVIKLVNEGRRSYQTGKNLKAIGMQAGLPDYLILAHNTHWKSLWLEMKTRDKRNRKKDPNQEGWLAKLNGLGHYATFCYGWEHAAQLTTDFLNDKL